MSQPPANRQRSSPGPEADARPVVGLRGVSKSFGRLDVLHDIDLDIRRGDCTVVLGPSGTGKSVLLKLIVGLLKPDQGEVSFDGERIDQMNDQQLVQARRRIGFLFQMGALFDSMTVGENVAFPLIQHTQMSPAERARQADQVLRMVSLPDIEGKMPGDLSGGQRKRVALARAIVLNPSLVLYDEPTTGLDPIRADVINELILSLNRELGISSIVVTHDMASARKIADRMILIYAGRVVADGAPDDFLAMEHDLVQRFIAGQAAAEDLEEIRRGVQLTLKARGGQVEESAIHATPRGVQD